MILTHNKDFKTLTEETEKEMKKIGLNTDPGAICRLFANIINKRIVDFYDFFTNTILMAFISKATEEFLDNLGMLLGCERKINEEDDIYRKRICNQVTSLAKANEIAIRLAILSIDRVKDVKMKKHTNGPGSFTVIPILYDINLFNETYSDIEKQIQDVMSFGEKVIIKQPTFKQVKLKIVLSNELNLNDTQKQSIKISVRENIIKYVNSIKIGESLIINELTQIIMGTNDSILNYSIKEFKINNDNCLILNQGARWDEKFIVSQDSDSIIVS